MAKKHKSEREIQLLLNEENEKVIREALSFSKTRFKKFDEIIIRVYAGENLDKFFNTDKRIWKINECFKSIPRSIKTIFKDALVYLDKYSELITDEPYIQAVCNMVQFKPYWRNDMFEWKPASKQVTSQMKELTNFLFCEYNVPGFLYKAFYETKNSTWVNWFIHLGTGRKVKGMKDIPIPFTQKMGHYFTNAHEHLSIPEALRWAQVRGLGGDEKLADRIVASWIAAKPYGNEEFWETFLQLLIRGGMFNHNKITELIDYVREAKRENQAYHLKGRTLQSLMRQSDEWHNRFTHFKGNQVWKPCGIEGYRVEKKAELIVLEELNEAKKLTEEGKNMKHCVGSYAFYCAKGKTAIFSLRKYSSGKLLDTMATIEVNVPLKKIVQAKAKMNKPISDDAMKYMDTWANNQGLMIGSYL